MIKLKREIDNTYTQEIQKRLLFTKQHYYEAGGKSLKLLSYRLRKQQAENAIHTIKNSESGEIETKLEKIQQSFAKFSILTIFPATSG